MIGRIAIVLGVCVVAVVGWNPLAAHRDTSGLLVEGYGVEETGVERQANGVLKVRALTRMPGVRAEMVRWWFADFLQTTAHYQRWHPTAHVWMDWENKVPGAYVGASHLVHEYIGDELMKLRIQFVPPEELLGEIDAPESTVFVCARAGLLEESINVSTMCHVIRDTDFGAEMRSVFWMGHIARRNGNEEEFSIEGLLGNTALVRMLAVSRDDGVALMRHAIEEMGYLADFLPGLYASEHERATIGGAAG